MSLAPKLPTRPGEADIARAVSLFLRVPAELPEVASIAQRIASSSIDPNLLSDPAALAQSADFQQKILQVGGDDLARLIDPARKEQVAREAAAKANVTSADGALGERALGIIGAGVGGRPMRAGEGGSPSGSGGSSSLRYGGMGDTPSANYAAQYSGSGLSPSMVSTLEAVSMSRTSYDAMVAKYGKEHKADILDAAKDTKAMGWTGADAVDDTYNAPKPIREEGIDLVKNAKTNDDWVKGLSVMDKDIEALPPDQRAKAAPYRARVQKTYEQWLKDHPDAVLASDAIAQPTDQSVASKVASEQKDLVAAKSAPTKVASTDEGAAAVSAPTHVARASGLDDVFGEGASASQTAQNDAASAQVKAGATKVASADPAAGGQKSGGDPPTAKGTPAEGEPAPARPDATRVADVALKQRNTPQPTMSG